MPIHKLSSTPAGSATSNCAIAIADGAVPTARQYSIAPSQQAATTATASAAPSQGRGEGEDGGV